MLAFRGSAAHLPGMRTEDRRLRLRMTRRDEPDLGKLIEWVLNIAEARHRAWLDGEPDPYGLPVPEDAEQMVSPEHGPANLAGPSSSTGERIA